jgi:hypothetical protein
MHAHLDEAMAHIRRFRKPSKEASVEEVFVELLGRQDHKDDA